MILKRNIKVVVPTVIFLSVPLFVFADTVDLHSSMPYLEVHWGDIIALALVLISTGYAFLAAKIYGGIFGVALKFTSIGLIAIVLDRILNSFEHLGIEILSRDAGTLLDLIGFILITVGMYKLYTETKKLTSNLIV
jgi:hypothetical protein